MLVVAVVMLIALVLAAAVLAFVAYEHGHRPPRAPERVASAIDRVASTVRGALDEPEQEQTPGATLPRSLRAVPQPRPGTRDAVGPLGQRVRAARLAVQQRWDQEQTSRRREVRTPVSINLTDQARAPRQATGEGRRAAREAQERQPRPTVARHGAGRRA